MTPFKLDLSNKTILDKLHLGAAHIAAMTDNAHYPVAGRTPSDAQVLAAQTDLQTASAEAQAAELDWRASLEKRSMKEDAWDLTFTARAAGCAAQTPGDTVALTTTGFPLRKAKQSLGELDAPEQLRAEPGSTEGTIVLRCEAVRGAATYEWQCRERGEPDGPWSPLKQTTASRLVVPALKPVVLYGFRVRVTGTAGTTDWSDEKTCRAP